MKKMYFSILIYLFGIVFFAVVAYAGDNKDILTLEERLWLTQHQSNIVYALETNYSPFVFIDSKEQPNGLAYDYMRLVESKLGVTFKERRFSSLDDIFSKVHSKEVNIVNAVTATPKRSEFLLFTEPFITVPNVILVNKNKQNKLTEKDLKGLNVSLVNSYAVTEYLINKGIVVAPILAPDDLSSLLNVSFGRADVAVIDLATASNLISKNGITNLRVAGTTDFNIQLAMATSIDEPILRAILQKGITSITQEERDEIHERWINASEESIFKEWQFWAIITGLLAIILAIVIWNRTLQYQVKLRTKAEKELQHLNAELEESKCTLQNTLDEQKALYKVQTIGFIHTIDRNIAWCNETFETMLGYEKGELQGKPARIMYEDEAEYIRFGKDAYEAINKSGIFTCEMRCIKKDGTKLIILGSLTSLSKSSNEVIGTAIDITEMKKQAQLIEQQKEEFEAIFKNSKDGIAIFDLKSKFLEFNDAYLKMTGLTREELLTKSCIEMAVPEDIEKSKEVMEEVVKNGFVENFEKSCLIKDNKVITINMSLSLMPDCKRVIVVTKNITQNKLFESQAKLASMGEMIGNIAHQWRQPLSLITTLASGIAFKKEFGNLEEEEIVPNMEHIVAQANYLSKTIDDFRNFIKGENRETMINVFSLFDKIFSIVTPSLKNNYIEVITDIDSNITILGYENELMQAFINIINNAKDILVENNKIEDKYIFIDVKRIDDQCEITIKDNGGGVILSAMNRIFEPYFTTKHQSQGTGLGLSMAHKIITQIHKGTIEVSNTTYEYNQKEYTGASFHITFLVNSDK